MPPYYLRSIHITFYVLLDAHAQLELQSPQVKQARWNFNPIEDSEWFIVFDLLQWRQRELSDCLAMHMLIDINKPHCPGNLVIPILCMLYCFPHQPFGLSLGVVWPSGWRVECCRFKSLQHDCQWFWGMACISITSWLSGRPNNWTFILL